VTKVLAFISNSASEVYENINQRFGINETVPEYAPRHLRRTS
jgi:hypothetical protein